MKSFVFAGALMSLTALGFAQSSDMKAMAQQFGESAKANAAALKAYSWKLRVEVTVNDQTKPAKLFAMRFDQSGRVQKTELTQQAPPEKERGSKGKIVEKKPAEMKAYAADLAELCKGYLTPSPDLLQAFFSRVMTAQAPGGCVQLYAQGVIQPGDKVVYEIDPKRQAIHRILFHTTLENDPVGGTVEMATLPGGGPTYAAHATVNAPGKKLTAAIENYDYVHQ